MFRALLMAGFAVTLHGRFWVISSQSCEPKERVKCKVIREEFVHPAGPAYYQHLICHWLEKADIRMTRPLGSIISLRSRDRVVFSLS
jgi:hypothetical protein